MEPDDTSKHGVLLVKSRTFLKNTQALQICRMVHLLTGKTDRMIRRNCHVTLVNFSSQSQSFRTDMTVTARNSGGNRNYAEGNVPSDRPHSYPSENCRYSKGNNNGSIQNRLDEQPINPSQALCLSTTVPTNIASRTLGDKHTPTRNSLRHSRMIVMYRNGRVPKKYLPFVIRHYRLVKSMKVITIILGMLMTLVSVWLLLWSPTLSALEYPFWSAIPVFCSGVVGCFFLGFCPRPYPGRTLGCHYHFTKYVSILTTVLSVMTCIVVLILCIIHLIYIHTATCVPHDKFNTTCICSIRNATSSVFNKSYHYEDFTCEEVDCFLRGIMATSCVLNLLALTLEVMYLCVHYSHKKTDTYIKVPVREEGQGDER